MQLTRGLHLSNPVEKAAGLRHEKSQAMGCCSSCFSLVSLYWEAMHFDEFEATNLIYNSGTLEIKETLAYNAFQKI